MAQSPPPAINQGGIVNNASYTQTTGPIAPGSITAIFGTNLNDGSTVLSSTIDADGKLVTSLAGASVKVNDISAPLFYSTPQQLGIQIPVELAGQASASVQVTVNGQMSAPQTIFLDAAAPGIFTTGTQRTPAAAALHENNISPLSTRNPARPNEVIVLFATGLVKSRTSRGTSGLPGNRRRLLQAQ